MNYLILKSIVDATLTHFTCKNCASTVSEQNINILGTAGNNLNMEVICPKCKTAGVIKAEINMLGNQNIAGNIKQLIDGQNNEEANAINDLDILKLREDLKNCWSMEDLFKS